METTSTHIWEKFYPPGVSWRAPLLKKPVFHILDQGAAQFPEHDLCIFEGKHFTFTEILQAANKVAAGLQKMGVGKGTKVGLLLPNTPYAIICHYGILKTGATVVNYNPLYAEHELKNQINDSGTEIMFTVDLPFLTEKVEKVFDGTKLDHVILCPIADVLPFPKNIFYPLVKPVARPRDKRFTPYKNLIANDGAFTPPVIDTENDIAVLQYTGGTTGVPKGASLTHANIYINTQQTLLWMRSIEPGKDRILGVLPFFHVFAMTVIMHSGVATGTTIVLHPKFEADAVIKSIRKYKLTLVPVVPAILAAIAKHPGVKPRDFAHVKCCISGGAPLPDDVRKLSEQKTGVSKVVEGYGLSETSPVVSFNPPLGVLKAGSVGMPIPGTIVEIMDMENHILLSPGEKGEICIAGPQVMRGYHNKPEETATVMRGGRLHTGDIGYLDNEGYLFIVDRIKDMIMVRGYKVYPRYVEEALYKHPAVEECIVAGLPDAERGETVRAWVKFFEGKSATEDELKEFLKDKLSPIEIPRQIIIRTKPLPKTAVGKLSKKDLLKEEGLTPSAGGAKATAPAAP